MAGSVVSHPDDIASIVADLYQYEVEERVDDSSALMSTLRTGTCRMSTMRPTLMKPYLADASGDQVWFSPTLFGNGGLHDGLVIDVKLHSRYCVTYAPIFARSMFGRRSRLVGLFVLSGELGFMGTFKGTRSSWGYDMSTMKWLLPSRSGFGRRGYTAEEAAEAIRVDMADHLGALFCLQIEDAADASTFDKDDVFHAIGVSMVRRIFPQNIASQITSVQPMKGPTGLVYYMQSRYGKQSGYAKFKKLLTDKWKAVVEQWRWFLRRYGI